MTYTSLEQRMAGSYLDMLPRFVPDKNAPVSIPEQEQFYNLIKSLYRLAFDEPLLFVASLHEDDAYPNRFNKKSYGKPDLLVSMKKFTKALEALLQSMLLLGSGGKVTLNKRQQVILERLGISNFDKLPAAWVWMAKREGANLSAFSYCLFHREYPYTSDIYARLLGESAFRRLESWMLAQGYQRFDISDVTASDCKLSLTIANPVWSGARPNGGFEYKVTHTGISARFEPYIKNPAVFGLCIPKGLKLYLENFDSMDQELQDFVTERTKKCNACGYCVQTDKTGTRPLACVAVKHKGKAYNLCTYFPGYSYCWTSIDDGLVEQLIRMLSFLDRFAPRNTDKTK